MMSDSIPAMPFRPALSCYAWSRVPRLHPTGFNRYRM